MPHYLAASCLLSIVIVLALRVVRDSLRRHRLARQQVTLSELDLLLRDIEGRTDGHTAGRQELATVRGGTPRQHVWRTPGGEEVFLN